MAVSENSNDLDVEAKLKIVTSDIVLMVNQVHDLLKPGGVVDSALDTALKSFGPLMESLEIMNATVDTVDGQPSGSQSNRKTISGPKARRGSKRPSTSRLESPAKKTAPSENEPESVSESAVSSIDDSSATNDSPKLTHHSFRGDSTFDESNLEDGRTEGEKTLAEVTPQIRRVQTARKHTAKRQTARRGTTKR